MRNTPNYNLPQYEGADKFTKEVLNDAFNKIDSAINDLQETFNVQTDSNITSQIVNEVISARSGEENLKKRIDKVEETARNNNVVTNSELSKVKISVDVNTKNITDNKAELKGDILSVDNKKYDKEIVDKMLFDNSMVTIKPNFYLSSFTPAKNESRVMQSLCLFETDKKYLACTYCDKLDESLGGDIIVYDYYTRKQVSVYEDLPIYHGNDICFNSKTNEFLIVPMNDPRGNNRLVKYNSTFTTKTDIVYPNNNNYVSGVAYNKTQDKIIVVCTSTTLGKFKVDICNSDFSLVSSFECDKRGVFQSVESFGNYIYVNNNTYIDVYRLDGKLIRSYNIGEYHESEGIATFDGENFLIGKITSGVSEYGYNKSLFSRVYSFNLYNNSNDTFYSYKQSNLGKPKEKLKISNKIICKNGELNVATNITDNSEGAYIDNMNLGWEVSFNSNKTGIILNSRLHKFEKVNADTQVIGTFANNQVVNSNLLVTPYVTHNYGAGVEVRLANSSKVISEAEYNANTFKIEVIDEFSTLTF